METEFFERFISHLSLARCAINDYASLYLNEAYGYDNDVSSGKENGIEGLNSMFGIVYTSTNSTIFTKVREEILSNILGCNSSNYMIIANFYITRIISTQLNKLFIHKNYPSCDMEEFLSSNEPHKKLYAVCNIISDNCIFYALHNLIINAQKEYNTFIRFLYDTFSPLNVNLIPFYIDKNIHFYECDEYGGFLTDLTLKDVSNKTTHNIYQLILPKELTTPKAKELLDQAVKYNLLKEGYKWDSKLMTKRELAYLCYVLSNKLELSSISSKNDEGRNETNWKPFKELFNDNNLNNNLRGITSDDILTDTMDKIKGIYDF